MHALLPRLRPALAARRVVARLALLAVLAAALVPGISRLLQPADAWGLLCQSAQSALASATAPADGQPGGHAHGDACAFCTLAHTTPVLAGAAPAALAVLAYAPPAPPVPTAVRERPAQSRSPSARAPPFERPPLSA